MIGRDFENIEQTGTENLTALPDDLSAFQEGLKVSKATPEELEKLNLTLGAVRKATVGLMVSREVQSILDEQKSKVQIMTELAEKGLTLKEVAEKMEIPLGTASSIANVNGLSKTFKQNNAKKLGLPTDELEETAKDVSSTVEEQEPTEEPQGVTEESVEEDKENSVKGTFEMAEEVVTKYEKNEKTLVRDMLALASKYDLDFIGGMIVQAILKGDMYEAREYMADVMDGVKA
jgi:transcriptional regulator with XRE-family HTH domain